jgi:hypothetical protein
MDKDADLIDACGIFETSGVLTIERFLNTVYQRNCLPFTSDRVRCDHGNKSG